MASFVVDASATLSWCFEDEANAGADAFLERLRGGDQVCVPAHWPTEVSNGLLMALRKKRIKPGRFELFWDQLAALPITVEPPRLPQEVCAARVRLRGDGTPRASRGYSVRRGRAK